eukprot:GHVR01161147.1.p1 GENE.GHVR01161147.1~~GHVR01161147.1.p1  ORF type:complete len:173 (-),score=28.38 GHVR01161147.1:98-616(-)
MYESRCVRVVCTLIFLVVFILLVVLSLILEIFLLLIFSPVVMFNDRLWDRIISTPVKFLTGYIPFKLNPLWRLHILNPMPSVKDKKIILMCNHLSGLDPFVVHTSCFPLAMKYVHKSSLLAIPVVGWALFLCRELVVHFNDDRSGWGVDKDSVNTMMNRARDILRVCVSVCV